MSLRRKLLIAASLMLIFPVAGYRYVRAMEEFLRQDQSRAVEATARAIATALQTRIGLFRDDSAPAAGGSERYVQPLASAPDIDGYANDWGDLSLPARLDSDRLIFGRYRQYLYLLLAVRAPRVRFSGVDAGGTPRGDYLKLYLTDSPDYERSWLLAAAAPGRLLVRELSPVRGEILAAYPDSRIQGAVQPHTGGYVLELRIPAALLGTHLALEIYDNPRHFRRLPAAGNYYLRFPSPAISRLLDNIGPNPGQSIWVTDRRRRVLARTSAGEPAAIQPLSPLLRWLLPPRESDPLKLNADNLRLRGPELDSALAGTPSSRWRQSSNAGPYRLSAAYPVHRRDRVVGAVVVEQDAQEILALRIRALAELLLSTLLSFGLAGIGLLLVAGSMVRRLRHLRQATARSIDAHGRVLEGFAPPAGKDEIGDLGRSFAQLLVRLAQYNQYLEQLARRLTHELRTPLAIIRSSLDNLAMSRADAGAIDGQEELLQQRARQGVERLETIIKRMAEASRLEQALAATRMESVELVGLMAAAVAAHQQAWPQHPICCAATEDTLVLRAAPDLLLQAVDKLLANARDFSAPGEPIRVSLEISPERADLRVENQGPALPPGDPGQLFESMVSHRGARKVANGEPHLGLGLYVVRLVAQCHGGEVFAGNLADGTGVSLGFSIARRLPAS